MRSRTGGRRARRAGKQGLHGYRWRAAGRVSALFATAVLTLAPTALADPPSHNRAPALDLEGLNHACGVATDSKGDLYASSAGTDEIKVFDPSHALLTSISNANDPCGIAVDSKGKLYVSEQATGNVVRYTPNAYPFEGTPTYGSAEPIDSSGQAKGIAVDRTDDRLYVAKGTKVAIYKSDTSFEANVAEDPSADYTGVSAYTYIYTGGVPTNLKRHYYLTVADAATDQLKLFAAREGTSLKLRRTISGVDHDENPETPNQSFGFGPAGAHLAADPGNESRTTRACAQVQIEAKDQACTQGHFFVYDDANDAVDEFDATGEFVDQITNAAFADAEPTALAVERSGAAGDGTLYVSAGKEAGAKLLAFEPLMMPARDPLPALSRALTKARGVATDCEGYVYVAAESLIRVYSPNGSELTSFVDAEEPRDLAADCEGNVYVMDNAGGEPVLTYYSPSAYPPTGATAYTRHEPVLMPGEFESSGLQSVAVNPANGHVFVVRSGNVTPIIAEFDSAAEGSGVIGECGTGFGLPSGRFDIDVYGATGEVYVTANGQNLATLRCGAEPELLVKQIKGGGCPNGEFGSNPTIALDQSNGHIVEFEPGQPGDGAREYDSSGACVAEFGTFSSNAGGYRVAVDNSCALHDPPLSEATTPKCADAYPSNGNVYVASDGTENAVQPYDVTAFGPLEYPPPPQKPVVETGGADGFGPGKATLHGTVNPNSSQVEECTFEYLTEEKYDENGETFAGATVIPCAQSPEEIGNGGKPIPVHADIEGLEIATSYRYRLLATNEFGTAAGESKSFTLEPPVVIAKGALPVAYDEATLRGEINPSSSPTEYHFEYLTEEKYEDEGGSFANAQNTPTAKLAAGGSSVPVNAPVTGFEEGTSYRFQLVAKNAVAGAEDEGLAFETLERPPLQDCDNAEYRTGLSAFLPDCRAYELVTPAQMLSTSRGYQALGAFTSTAGHRFFNSWFVAPRGAGAGESVAFRGMVPRVDSHRLRAQRADGDHPEGGWETEPAGFSFAQGGGEDGEPGGVSADQSYFLYKVLSHETPTEDAFPVGNYLRAPSGEANPACTPDPEAFELSDPDRQFEMVGCGSVEKEPGVEEVRVDPQAEGHFVSAGGTHVIFSSDEDLEDDSPSAGVAIYDRQAGEAAAEVVSVKPDETPFEGGEQPRYIASSEDGEAVVFSVGGLGGALYVHRNGVTTQVAASPNTYAGISDDGKRVFFMDVGFFPSAGNEAPPPASLFACEVDEGACVGETKPGLKEIATGSNFVNVSADGSNVFFTSEEALTGAEENENGEDGEPGEPNLYTWDGATVRFIALLDPQDLISFRTGESAEAEERREDLLQWTSAIPGQVSTSGGLYESGRSLSPTRSTPDGQVFAFQSHAQLTSYDNEGKGEIYRYAPAAPLGSQLTCVSCDPSGAPHDSVADSVFRTAFMGNTESSTMIPNLTDDGRRVFFESRDALLPEDANEVTDVYEWKALGTTGPGGDECERPGGCLALISSGQSEEHTYLYGMDADGTDVFFITQEKLTGADVVGTFSIYDARALGGIPDPPVAAPCPGDACQGPASPPPALPTPASTGPGAEGAPAAKTSCPKGKHRVKGRCVKKKSKKRKGHSKKHSKKHRAGHDRGVRR